MSITVMDDELLEIYKIKNIEFIKVYDLFIQSVDTKNIIIPAIIINYDGNKILNLCSKDKNFDVFVRRILEVYKEEKDRPLIKTNPFTNETTNIVIDPVSKEILENGLLEEKNKRLLSFKNKTPYKEDFLYEKDKVSLLLPIIEYHLRELFNINNIDIHFNGDITGYRTNYTINATINGINTYLSLKININDNNYNVQIKPIDSQNIFYVLMNIRFYNNKIVVNTSYNDYLANNIEYIINENSVLRENYLYKNDILANYSKGLLPTTTFDYKNLIDVDEEKDYSFFALPWKAYIGINNKTIPIDQEREVIERNYITISLTNNSFSKKEYSSRTYNQNKDYTHRIMEATLDERIIDSCGYKIDDSLYLLKTYYQPTIGSSGFYNKYLSGNYYYRLAIAKDLASINKKKLIDINKKHIISREDIYMNERIKKIVR